MCCTAHGDGGLGSLLRCASCGGGAAVHSSGAFVGPTLLAAKPGGGGGNVAFDIGVEPPAASTDSPVKPTGDVATCVPRVGSCRGVWLPSWAPPLPVQPRSRTCQTRC